jgi:Fe-S-cluster containining protein
LPNSLPSLYAAWVHELLQGEVPEEPLATCDNCAMADNGGGLPQVTSLFFHPSLKCCTYLPELANFLVGRVLSDHSPDSAAGRATIEARILKGIAVTPLGLQVDARSRALYSGSIGAGSFGRSHVLRCPHLLENGRCGIWRHRESVCTTWFCKYQRGALGFEFWQSLRELLKTIEQALALWCLLELDFPDACLQQLLQSSVQSHPHDISIHDLEQQVDPSHQKMIWGEWLGREEELYSCCAHLVDSLTWSDVLAIGGPQLRARTQLLIRSYNALLSSDIPDRLTVGALKLVQISSASVNVSSYSDFDTVKMNRALYEALPFFDGRPVEEARQQIREEKGISVSLAIVRKLIDRRILVAGRSGR